MRDVTYSPNHMPKPNNVAIMPLLTRHLQNPSPAGKNFPKNGTFKKTFAVARHPKSRYPRPQGYFCKHSLKSTESIKSSAE